MSDLILPTLLKVLVPALAIAFMLFVAPRRGVSLSTDVGFRRPEPKWAVIFLVLWIVLVALEEFITAGMPDVAAKSWPDYPLPIVALRILAIGIVGPFAEEPAFRGLLMHVIGKRIGPYGAILITAALWSAIHLQYAPLLLAMIFFDGLVLGLARHFTRSLYIPIAMHVIGNLYSIYQSLGASA